MKSLVFVIGFSLLLASCHSGKMKLSEAEKKSRLANFIFDGKTYNPILTN